MLLESEPLVAQAYERMKAYASRLVFVRGSGRHTDLAALERLVQKYGNGHNVLIVDYLQKVSVYPEPANEAEKSPAWRGAERPRAEPRHRRDRRRGRRPSPP